MRKDYMEEYYIISTPWQTVRSNAVVSCPRQLAEGCCFVCSQCCFECLSKCCWCCPCHNTHFTTLLPFTAFFFDFRSPSRPAWCYYYDCLHICRPESADKLRGEFINLRVAAIRWLPRPSRTCHSYTCFHSKSINLARKSIWNGIKLSSISRLVLCSLARLVNQFKSTQIIS